MAEMAQRFIGRSPPSEIKLDFPVQLIDFERRTPEMCCLELRVRSRHCAPHVCVYLSWGKFFFFFFLGWGGGSDDKEINGTQVKRV